MPDTPQAAKLEMNAVARQNLTTLAAMLQQAPLLGKAISHDYAAAASVTDLCCNASASIANSIKMSRSSLRHGLSAIILQAPVQNKIARTSIRPSSLEPGPVATFLQVPAPTPAEA